MSRAEDLIAQYREIHADKVYGQTSEMLTGQILRQLTVLPKIDSVLDYGCGQARTVDWIGKVLDAEVHRYDPAIAAFSTLPKVETDFAMCVDVMEHIPLDDVDRIIGEIRGISEKAFFNISCVKAAQTLPNGENAHCTVRPPRWWGNRLRAAFPDARQIKSLNPNSASFVTWPRPDQD